MPQLVKANRPEAFSRVSVRGCQCVTMWHACTSVTVHHICPSVQRETSLVGNSIAEPTHHGGADKCRAVSNYVPFTDGNLYIFYIKRFEVATVF